MDPPKRGSKNGDAYSTQNSTQKKKLSAKLNLHLDTSLYSENAQPHDPAVYA